MRRILVTDLTLAASIGVNDDERRRRQPIVVNIALEVPDDPVADGDLDACLDYRRIVEMCRQVVDAGHIDLVEVLADRLAEGCLAEPLVRRVTVRVEKPEAIDEAGAVGVEVTRARDD